MSPSLPPLPLAITMGEPAGVGGELSLKAWQARHRAGRAFFVLDDPARLSALATNLGLDVPVREIDVPEDAAGMFGTALPVLPVRLAKPAMAGRPDPANAGATLDAIESGAARPVPQTGDATLAPKISVDDARVRWTDPAAAIDRQVRACTPEPGAWTTAGQTRLGIGPVRPASDEPPLAPGALRVGKRDVLVGTATTPVRLGLVRPAGKREMLAADWARGVRLTDADVLT